MLYCAVSNVTGSQTSTVAVGGDRVEYTCQILFHGNVSPSLRWSRARYGHHDVNAAIWTPGRRYTVFNETVSWEVSTISVNIPNGPATVSPTCHVYDYGAGWSRVYFWRSTPITVSCEYKNTSSHWLKQVFRPGNKRKTRSRSFSNKYI